MEDAENYLRQRWKLHYGQDSKMVMSSTHCLVHSDDIPGWKKVASMRCLGHHLAGNSSISVDMSETVRGIWAAYWRNCGRGLQRASETAQANFMRASLRSIAAFRWSRWPWQKTYAQQLDGLQRHIIGCMRPLSPLPGEDAPTYFKRKHLASTCVADRWGKWSTQWAKSVTTWDAHIGRAHDTKNWTLPLTQFHGEGWLNRQRFENSQRNQWGRTRTRTSAGRPATRWHEGVLAAHNLLQRI